MFKDFSPSRSVRSFVAADYSTVTIRLFLVLSYSWAIDLRDITSIMYMMVVYSAATSEKPINGF